MKSFLYDRPGRVWWIEFGGLRLELTGVDPLNDRFSSVSVYSMCRPISLETTLLFFFSYVSNSVSTAQVD